MTDATSDTGTESETSGIDGEPTFDAPWQARAFAVAVAITDEDDLPWNAFQSRLVTEIEGDNHPDGESHSSVASDQEPDAEYYHQWIAALERLVIEEELLTSGELSDRIAAFEAGDRSAHEFVHGDPHAHTERLPEDHAEGSVHSHLDHEHPH